MKTVVGIIDNHAEAEHVVQELVQNGFPRDEIKMVYEEKVSEQEAAQEASSDLKDLHTALLEAGMPDAAARHYEEEIHHGKTLITVRASDDMADRACDIIEDEADEVEEYDLGGEEMSAEPAMPIEAIPHQEIEPVSTLESTRAQQLGSAAAATSSTESSAASTHGVEAEADIAAESAAPMPQAEAKEEIKIPIVEERLKVGKREAESGGVRIEPHVTEKQVEEGVTLRSEDVKVERITTDRPASEADIQAAARGPVEVREFREEPVVEKEARVVGEVRVTKEASERQETVSDTVRTTDVNVDELAARYRNEERFRGRNWSDVEPELQSDWETHRPGSWERFKDSIRNAWERP
jgi:stress response protein YsnF